MTVPATTHAANRRVLRNVGANFVGATLSAALPLLTLPIYLRALGTEHWGLVSFVALFVSVLSILDAGFSQALVKEFASLTTEGTGRARAAANLLFSYERIYAGFALLLSLIVAPFADLIASSWLNLGSLPKGTGVFTIYCACATFVAQFPGSIFRTVLVARQEQVKLNKIQVSFLLLRHAGGVALVLLWPNIEPYLVWQVACTAFETIWTAVQAWREMPASRQQSRWDAAAVASTARFSGFMAASVLLGAATGMVDKFYIAAKLPIAELGYYAVASSVSFGLLRLSYPLFTAVLPRLTQLQGSEADIQQINRRLLTIVTSGLLAFLAVYLLFGRDVIIWWLKSEATVDLIVAPLNFLLVACGLNLFYNIGYTNWVAAGKARAIMAINIASFAVALVITPFAVARFGITGAAASAVLMNSIGALVSLSWIVNCHIRCRRPMQIQKTQC
jgi:O-antigen/teichoic acid export membrane protein